MTKKKSDELKVEEHPSWSPTRVDLADSCMKAYWFQYVFHLEHFINPSIARGKLLHRMIQNFWKVDEKTGFRVPGYSSYSAFVNSAKRDWKFQFAGTGESDGQKIEWDFKGQQWSKDFIGEIADTCGRIYTRYISEEPRLEPPELKIKGEFGGVRIEATIDELRKGLVIRDHKSGYRKHGEFYLKNNIQMTDYLLCVFCALQDSNSKVSKKIYPEYTRISIDDFVETASIEIHDISQSKRYKTREMTEIYYAKRRIRDFEEFIQTIKLKEKAIKERDFHPTKGKLCDYCFYRRECSNYNPDDYHRNEFEQKNPLFAFAEIDAGSFVVSGESRVKKMRRQKTFRYKYD